MSSRSQKKSAPDRSRQQSVPDPPHNIQRVLRYSEDWFCDAREQRSSSLWLGRFSSGEIMRSWEKIGFLEALRARQLQPLLIVIEPIDSFVQALKLFHAPVAPERLLAEFRLREKTFAPKSSCAGGLSAPWPRVLAIEWLVLQNPRASFTPQHPRLPGQRHPGLGLARRILQWLIELARELQVEGLTNFPEYFHNAHLYREHFHFYDPGREGRMRALARDLLGDSLADTSWGIELGRAREAGGGVFEWESDLQILPLSTRLAEYFAAKNYRDSAGQACAGLHFHWNAEEPKSARLE